MKSDQEAEYREYVASRAESLRRFAYLCCGDWHRAEDAVQTALARLYTAWHRARKVSVDAYVRRIVVNALIDEHRRAWFRRERASEILPERPVPDASVATAERLTLLDAVLRLPRRQRAAVVLRYWEDRPVEQTAQIMSCSTGSVKSLCSRGLDTLRRLLAEQPLDNSNYQGVSS